MGAIQHVMRRGAMYWWRRRLIEKAGRAIELRLRSACRRENLRWRARSPRISRLKAIAFYAREIEACCPHSKSNRC